MAGSLTVWILALTVWGSGHVRPTDEAADLAAFQARLERYAEMHRRLEGPLPPMMSTSDMNQVRALMGALREKIRSARGAEAQGHLLDAAMRQILRRQIATTLTIADLLDTQAELAEHTPPGMRPLVINEPLPEDAPKVMIAPQLLRQLPTLPKELRWIVLADALVIWDFHADLVVDMAPGLFDPQTYARSKTPARGRNAMSSGKHGTLHIVLQSPPDRGYGDDAARGASLEVIAQRN